MKLYDEDGRIMIDESAAEKDIANLRVSKANLENALSFIDEINIEAAEFSGNTGLVLVDSSANVKKQIKKLISETELAIESIERTIGRYQDIDRKLKDTVNNFGD